MLAGKVLCLLIFTVLEVGLFAKMVMSRVLQISPRNYMGMTILRGHRLPHSSLFTFLHLGFLSHVLVGKVLCLPIFTVAGMGAVCKNGHVQGSPNQPSKLHGHDHFERA